MVRLLRERYMTRTNKLERERVDKKLRKILLDDREDKDLKTIPRRLVGNKIVQEKESWMGFDPSRYRCKGCQLYFMVEEIELKRYSPKTQLCARCYVEKEQQLGRIEPPKCYGISYNGADRMCTKLCGLQPACLIQFADGRVSDWKMYTLPAENASTTGKNWWSRDLIRLMRLVGQPLHYMDIGPLLAKYSRGRFDITYVDWKRELQGRMTNLPGLVDLGSGFHIWIGAWDPETQEGIPGYKVPRQAHKTIDELLKVQQPKVVDYGAFEEDMSELVLDPDALRMEILPVEPERGENQIQTARPILEPPIVPKKKENL